MCRSIVLYAALAGLMDSEQLPEEACYFVNEACEAALMADVGAGGGGVKLLKFHSINLY